jgi:serine protease Do
MKRSGFTALAMIITVVLAGLGLYVTVPDFASAETAPAPLRQLGESFVTVAEKVTPAVVNISSSKKVSMGGGRGLEQLPEDHPFREFFGEDFFKRFFRGPQPGKGFQRRGMGSGVIVSADGHILTNSHVVRDADEIKVTLTDKRSFEAKVIGEDRESDVAVIKIDASDLPTAKLGNSSNLRVGEVVLAIGNPFGLDSTVTSGIISATGRTNVGIIDYEDFIQTDAAINPGNSGGPLVNIEGEVIGINTAIATRSGGYQGIGFAIPSNTAQHIMESLVKYGKVRRGFLGINIQDLTGALAKSFGKEDASGALVSRVIPGSPAEEAGIQDEDIVIKFNGQDVDGAAHLKNLVGSLQPNAKATVTVLRDGKEKKITLKVGERPKKFASRMGGEEETEVSNALGVELGEVPSAIAKEWGLGEGQGVRVTDIEADGVGRSMGLRRGDVILSVNGQSVSDVASFNAAIEEAKKEKGKVVRLKVQRGKEGRLYLAGELG